MNAFSQRLQLIITEISKVILDKEEEIEMILATWLIDGHVLLEDLPGTGKTVLAKAFAKVCQLDFGRVQFTPDLLPSDILGSTIYDQESKKFFFKKGPLFSDFFLADEINRATPRTQSALLEAMAERQITVEGKSTPLSDCFIVMATQNPLESHGVFPLPEAQLDRFAIKLSLGFVNRDIEAKVVRSQLLNHPLDNLKPLLTQTDFSKIKNAVKAIKIDDKTLNYLLEIVEKTRNHPKVKYGVSPRASLTLAKLGQAMALIQGREFAIPGDVYKVALAVLSHRLVLEEDALFEGVLPEDIISEILKSVKEPKA